MAYSFTYMDALAPPTVPFKPRRGRPAVTSQCLVLQRIIFESAVNGDAKPMELAQLVRGYCDLEKLKRTIRGQPATTSQSIRDDKPPKRKPRSLPVQVIEPPSDK